MPGFISAAVQATATLNPQTVTKAVTKGNTLIWMWWSGASAGAADPTPSDGVNSWTKDPNARLVGGAGCIETFYTCKAATTGTITVTASAGFALDGCALIEINGYDITNTSAKNGNVAGATGIEAESGSAVTPTKDGCYLISFIFDNNVQPTVARWTPGNGWTDRPTASNDPGGAAGITWHVADMIQGKAAAITPKWTTTTAEAYDTFTIALEPALPLARSRFDYRYLLGGIQSGMRSWLSAKSWWREALA